MLVSWDRTVLLALVWSLNPVPSAVSVSSETPGVLQAALIGSSSSEADHHAGGASSLAKSGRVVHSDLWSFSATIEFDPGEWSLLDTEAPNVIDGLLSGVTTKNEEMWLREDNGMSISSSWS